MSRARNVIVVLLVAGALVAGIAWYTHDESASSKGDFYVFVRAPRPQQSAPAKSTHPAVNDRASATSGGDLESQFRESDDLLSFVEGIQDAARAGDAAASYWMYRVLSRCDSEYRMFFSRRRQIMTLDEALQRNTGNPVLPEDQTRKIYTQCQRMRESDMKSLGDPDAWLRKASDAGDPLAQIKIADRLAVDASIGDKANAPALRAEARRLTLEAIRSKLPGVVAGMSGVVTFLSDSENDGAEERAWLLAACQRGFDCSAQSEMFRLICGFDTNCQPYETLVDVMRRHYSDEFDAYERRAREINELIDQGRFDELGL